MPETMYYIQNVGYCGNCLKWWRNGGHGYTMDLNDAWKVGAAQAASICRTRPKEDIAWDAGLIDEIAARHIDCEALRAAIRDGIIVQGVRRPATSADKAEQR